MFFCHFPPQWPLSFRFMEHIKGLIALIWIPLVKPSLWWCSSDHLLTSKKREKKKNIYPSHPPYLLLWLGVQEEVLPLRPISTDVVTKLQLFMMDGQQSFSVF